MTMGHGPKPQQLAVGCGTAEETSHGSHTQSNAPGHREALSQSVQPLALKEEAGGGGGY